MSFVRSFYRLAILASVFLGLGQTVPAQEQAESSSIVVTNERQTAQPGEIIFIEIELTPEGTIAYDADGNRWRYSYNQDQFVLDTRPGETEGQGPDSEIPRDQPVETRCTEELEVDGVAIRSVFVGYDEYVEGNITSLDRVTVKGWVKGNVTSTGGRVVVTSSGRVDGDVRAREIDLKRGGVIRGSQIISDETFPPGVIVEQFTTSGIWVVFAFTLVLLIIGFVVAALAPRQLQNFTECMHKYKIKSFFLGLLAIFLLPVAMGILAVTLVGPLLLGIAVLSSLALGMCVIGFSLTPLLYKEDPFSRPLLSCFVGIMAFMLLWALVAVVIGSGPAGSGVTGWGIPLLVIAILATCYPLLAGLGTALMTRFGFRQYVSYRDARPSPEDSAPTPAPPPMPNAPGKPSIPSPPRPPSIGHPPGEPDGPGETR